MNVSPVQFEQKNYPDQVLAVLEETGVAPHLLILELTEGVLVKDTVSAAEHLKKLRGAGVRIALDDFGTGYSALSYLADLPADIIKLDHTFVQRQLPANTTVIDSVVAMAHRLGLQVLAEGVESSEDLRVLSDLSCDQFQGYHFSRPMPAAVVGEFLAARSHITDHQRAPEEQLV